MKYILIAILILFSSKSFAQWRDKIVNPLTKSSLIADKISKVEIWYNAGKTDWLQQTLFLNDSGQVINEKFIQDSDTTEFDFESYLQNKRNSTEAINFKRKKTISTNDEGYLISETLFWKLQNSSSKTIKYKYIKKYYYDDKGLLVLVRVFSYRKLFATYKFKYFGL